MPTRLAVLAGLGLLWASSPAGAVDEANFRVKTTGDLVDLCGARPGDPLYTAAVNFCEGFLVGSYQYHQISQQAEGGKPLFCPPHPQPTRARSMERFVQWGRAHPDALAQPPVDGLFQFLAQTFPCRG